MKTLEFHGIKIKLDRPKGYIQEGKDKDGKPWKRVYKFNYGFIPRTQGGDGDELDVFVGPNSTDPKLSVHWVIQKKDDGSFDEYKVFLGFESRAAAKQAYKDHIPMKYFGGMVSMSLGMLQSLVGTAPKEKVATLVSFLSELENINEAHR